MDDKNDPFNRPSGNASGGVGDNHDEEHEFIDDARYDDPNAPEVREAEYAAGQEEWDQPVDEFAEEEEQQAGAQPHEEQQDPFAEEGPVEDEFSEHSETDQNLEDDAGDEAPQPRASASSTAGMKPPSSLMKNIPYIGGGLAAVVIAFFGLQQFMGDSSSTSTQPSLENQNTWDSTSANSTQQATAQQPAANEFQPLATPTQAEQPAQQPSATSTNMITPTATETPNTQAELPQATTTQQQASNPLETRITELTQQLETMKQTQDDLNQKLQAATAAPPSMDESSKAAQQALVDRIAQLEQKLSAAESSSSSSSSGSASSSIDAPTGKASRKSKRTSETAGKASTDFMVAKKPKRSKRRTTVDANSTSGTEGYAPVNSAPFQGWILRSAQPGSAWLSQGAYSSDLRRVVPGDKVQGLGTVTAIRQIAGRWVVEGTQGAVR